MDTYAHETAQLTIGLEREAEQRSAQDLAIEALAAMEVLTAGWLEPTAWELYIACCDTELFYTDQSSEPPRPDWALLKEPLPDGVRAPLLHINPMLHTSPALTPERTRRWMAEALAQECPGGPRTRPMWCRLWSRAMRAKLPNPTRAQDQAELHADCYAGVIPIPLQHKDDGVWVAGPLEGYVIGPPLGLTLGNDDGLLTISIEVYWDLWLDALAGREQIESALDRVLALDRGWYRTSE